MNIQLLGQLRRPAGEAAGEAAGERRGGAAAGWAAAPEVGAQAVAALKRCATAFQSTTFHHAAR